MMKSEQNAGLDDIREYNCVECGERVRAIIGGAAERRSMCHKHTMEALFMFSLTR